MLQLIRKIWKRPGIRYLFIGSWNTVFGFIVFCILRFVAMPPLNTFFVVTITSVISISQSFLTQRKLVWRSKNAMRNEFLKFGCIAALQYIAGLTLIIYLVDYKKFSLLPTQLAVSVILVVVTFFIMRSWIFTSRAKDGDANQSS